MVLIILFKKSYNITVASNAFSGTLETDADLTLEPFDEEDYNLTFKTTGKTENLTNQKLTVSGRTVTLIWIIIRDLVMLC